MPTYNPNDKKHPRFPRTPQSDNMTSHSRTGRPELTTEHSNTDYNRNRSSGSPFSSSNPGSDDGESFGNHDTPRGDRSGPIRRPGRNL